MARLFVDNGPVWINFWKYPRLRMFAGPLVPSCPLAERVESAQEAHRYKSKHIARVGIERSETQSTPYITNQTYPPSVKVLFWSEKIVENRIGEWVGLCKVTSFDERSRIIFVQKGGDNMQALGAKLNVFGRSRMV